MKCWKKLSVLVACLCSFCVCGLFGTNNASAASVGTAGFDLNWRPTLNSSYRWKNGMGYGESSGIGGNLSMSAKQYQFTTGSVTATGNYATIHFETNIVSTIPGNDNSNYFVNLPQQNVIICSGNGNFSGLRTITKSLSYAVTPNWSNGNTSNTTVTFYGTITLAGLTSGQTGSFTCMIGSDYDFFYSNYVSSTYVNRLWFEKNPIDITFTTNETDALLRQQIGQNQQMIEQQQQIIDQDNKDRDDIEQGQEDAEEQGEAAGAAASATGQTLMQAFTSLITALTGIHETNCNLPNFSLYGLNFTNMNMCMFDVPNGLMGLASIGMVFIIVPLGINLVKRMIALYNEIVGGGK